MANKDAPFGFKLVGSLGSGGQISNQDQPKEYFLEIQ